MHSSSTANMPFRHFPRARRAVSRSTGTRTCITPSLLKTRYVGHTSLFAISRGNLYVVDADYTPVLENGALERDQGL